jgi:hypothetical protein
MGARGHAHVDVLQQPTPTLLTVEIHRIDTNQALQTHSN